MLQFTLQLPGSCIAGADDPEQCTFLGYMRDGVPIHGYCNHPRENVQLSSCWVCEDGATNFSQCVYNQAGYELGTCHLDQANGFLFDDGYRYVISNNLFYVPPKYAGSIYFDVCGFSPE